MRASFPITVELRVLVILFFCCLTSCANFEDKRFRELINESGFGTRAEGEATVENYLSGGDGVVFLVGPEVLTSPGAERLVLLTQAQKVGIDGTILVPYVGPVLVLGMTERELKRMVESQLEPFFDIAIEVQARIINSGKFFYVFGEAGRKGPVGFARPDLTILQAVFLVGYTPLANLGRVRVIRPDAENPLIFEVNIREMLMTGKTHHNVLLRENDFIYIPPTWMGGFSRFLQKLLAPLGTAVQAMFGVATIRASYDLLQGDNSSFFFRY